MKNVIFGYARVSTREQSEKRQTEQLKAAGVLDKHIIIDKESGKDFNRREYQRLIQDRLSEGDTLVICSIDRLGRNYSEIGEQWRYITQTLKANIKVLDMPLLDTTANAETLDSRFVADLVLQILSYVADKERKNIKRRQTEGMAVMKVGEDGKRYSNKTGKPIGRPKAEYPPKWEGVYKQWKAKEITAKVAMLELGLKRNTFYNLVSRYEGDNAETA